MIMYMYIVLFSLTPVAVLGVTVEQSDLSWTKLVGKRVFISCKVSGLSTSDYVHWYQQKDREALKRILYVNQDGSVLTPDSDHPQAREFNVRVDKRSNSYELRVDRLKTSHTAVYYCACWESGPGYTYKVFGSGTRLIVTEKEEPVRSPKLSGYPRVSLDNGKTLLLCQARDMSPEVVRFTWKKGTTAVKDNPLEHKDEGNGVTSMLILNNDDAKSTFTCSVQHESSISVNPSVDILQEGPQTDSAPPTQSTATCPPQTVKNVEGTNSGSSDLVQKLYLFNLTYVSLLVKNVLYFCVVGVLLYKRRAGNSETVSKSSATPSQNN